MNMNIPLSLPNAPKDSLGSVLLAHLRGLAGAPEDRARSVDQRARPYSYLSECECPHDCLRDHENE